MKLRNAYARLFVLAALGGIFLAFAIPVYVERGERAEAKTQAEDYIKARGIVPIETLILNCNQGPEPTACQGRPYLVKILVPNDDKSKVRLISLWAGGPLGATVATETRATIK